jgi:hypothetical protein
MSESRECRGGLAQAALISTKSTIIQVDQVDHLDVLNRICRHKRASTPQQDRRRAFAMMSSCRRPAGLNLIARPGVLPDQRSLPSVTTLGADLEPAWRDRRRHGGMVTAGAASQSQPAKVTSASRARGHGGDVRGLAGQAELVEAAPSGQPAIPHVGLALDRSPRTRRRPRPARSTRRAPSSHGPSRPAGQLAQVPSSGGGEGGNGPQQVRFIALPLPAGSAWEMLRVDELGRKASRRARTASFDSPPGRARCSRCRWRARNPAEDKWWAVWTLFGRSGK